MKTQTVLEKTREENLKMGDLKKLAKEIKKDHEMALTLWKTKEFRARQMAVLILDKGKIEQAFIESLVADLNDHPENEQNQIMEWFMANQLVKSKKLISLMESWRDHDHPLLRRTFWYYQARLRWTGQTSFENTPQLLSFIEKHLAEEVPQVQYTMNFVTGWIGVFQPEHRERCIAIGEKTGLYKDEVVPKNCTPSYLPEFIRIEVGKRE